MLKDKERYEYLFVDAQLFLTRNYMMLKNGPYFSEQGLFKSFIQSIVKLVRDEINTNHVVLLWDKSPYHKIAQLQDYKGDRVYESENDITDDMSEEEKARLRRESELFKARQNVKYDLVFNSYRFGMPSLVKTGYEADDFGYMASISDLVQNAPGKSILCSKDGDQIWTVNEKFDFYRITKNREFYTLDSIKDQVKDMNPYQYVMIDQSLHGSHNFLKNTRHTDCIDTIHEINEKIQRGDYSFTSNESLFKNQYDSFKVWEYPEYDKAKWMINNIPLKAEFMDESQFTQYCLDKGINITYKYYKNFKDMLGK